MSRKSFARDGRTNRRTGCNA